MGNNDDLMSAISSQGTNRVEQFNGGYFSFAFGNEIALVLEDRSGYFILNCGEELFNEVKNKIIETKGDKQKLINFWIDKSKEYEVSNWSGDFEKLTQKIKGEK